MPYFFIRVSYILLHLVTLRLQQQPETPKLHLSTSALTSQDNFCN